MLRRIVTPLLILLITCGVTAGCGRRNRPPSGQPTGTPSATATTAPTGPTTTPTPPPSSHEPPTPPTTKPPTTKPPTTAPPAPTLPARLRGKDIEYIPTTQPVVALTFDAGANSDGLISILTALSAHGVHGTFFLTGGFADRNQNAVRAIVGGGHRLANHSYSHRYFTQKADSQIRDELARAEAAIRSRGADPRPLFRFPFGDRNTRTIATVNTAGYACVRWTVDTLGWKGTSEGITAGRVVERVLSTARPGQIVLMHVGSHPKDHSTLDADALPQVITQLRARGYRFATLDALL